MERGCTYWLWSVHVTVILASSVSPMRIEPCAMCCWPLPLLTTIFQVKVTWEPLDLHFSLTLSCFLYAGQLSVVMEFQIINAPLMDASLVCTSLLPVCCWILHHNEHSLPCIVLPSQTPEIINWLDSSVEGPASGLKIVAGDAALHSLLCIMTQRTKKQRYHCSGTFCHHSGHWLCSHLPF